MSEYEVNNLNSHWGSRIAELTYEFNEYDLIWLNYTCHRTAPVIMPGYFFSDMRSNNPILMVFKEFCK